MKFEEEVQVETNLIAAVNKALGAGMSVERVREVVDEALEEARA